MKLKGEKFEAASILSELTVSCSKSKKVQPAWWYQIPPPRPSSSLPGAVSRVKVMVFQEVSHVCPPSLTSHSATDSY